MTRQKILLPHHITFLRLGTFRLLLIRVFANFLGVPTFTSCVSTLCPNILSRCIRFAAVAGISIMYINRSIHCVKKFLWLRPYIAPLGPWDERDSCSEVSHLDAQEIFSRKRRLGPAAGNGVQAQQQETAWNAKSCGLNLKLGRAKRSGGQCRNWPEKHHPSHLM